MQRLASLAWARLLAAAHTTPPAVDPRAVLVIATFAAVVLPFGAWTGILQLKIEKRPAKWAEVRQGALALFVRCAATQLSQQRCPRCCLPAQVLFVVFLSRGLAEELVFRVMALPHPAVDGPTSPAAFAARCGSSCCCLMLLDAAAATAALSPP